jgi:hypothetical protein
MPSANQATRQQQDPCDQHHDGHRQHQRHDRSHPRALLVALGEGDDHREIHQQRGEGVGRGIADPIGREHGLRRNPQTHKQGHENRRENRPFGQRPGNDEIQHQNHQDEADQQRNRGDARLPEPAGQRRGDDARHVGVIEVGDELGDHQQHENHAGQPREGLHHGGDHVVRVFIRAGRRAIGHAGDEEAEHHDEEQAAHEWSLADDRAGFRIAQRRAGRQRGEKHDDQHAEEGDAGPLQAAGFEFRVQGSAAAACDGSPASAGSYFPSRGSTNFTITNPMTMVRKMAEKAWKNSRR